MNANRSSARRLWLGLGLAALVLVLCGTALLLRPAASRGTREATLRLENPSHSDALQAEHASTDPNNELSLEEGARRAIAPAERTQSQETHWFGPQSTGGYRLHGTLRHASDRRPAAGVWLNFSYGLGDRIGVQTDANGVFESAPVLPPGALHILEMGPLEPRIRPLTVLLEVRADGTSAPVELFLVDPEAALEIEVRGPNGVPAAAEVHWEQRSARAAQVGGWIPGRRAPAAGARTDELGRLRLPLSNLVELPLLSLWAQEGELVSEFRIVEPSVSDRVQLTLDATGSLRVRVLSAEGKPASGERLRLDAEQLDFATVDDSSTDEVGLARFSFLAPGRYRVRFWSEKNSEWIQKSAEVERGLEAELELRPTTLPLAVAGRVLAENGAYLEGIQLFVQVGETRSVTTVTNESGAFSVGSDVRGPVHVSVALHALGSRFQPAEIEVPFGTEDVLLRRIELLPSTELTLEILAQNTRERIPGAIVLAFVEPRMDDVSVERAPDGLVTLELKLYPDVWLTCEAVGYRRRRLQALALFESESGATRSVWLEPGFQRALVIRDEKDDTPLAGARVLDGERVVAIADGDGRAQVDLPSWPDELRITAAEHRDGRWTRAEWLGEPGDGEIRLEQVPTRVR